MSIVCMGELLIDFVALESGVTVGEASGFEKAPGGAPANVAVALSRLGHQAAFLGQVGDDPFGHYLKDVLDNDNVDTRGLSFSTEARTMLAFVSLAEGGERSFVFYRHPSADMLMTSEALAMDVIDEAQAFHFGSITLISEPSRSATLAAAQRARDKGLILSYDPNLRLNLWPDAETARAGMLEGLNYATVVKISDDELDFLSPDGTVEGLWRGNMQLLVVTHGADGSTAYTQDGKSVFQKGRRAQTIDTTGAGDGFVAGLLASLIEYPDYTSPERLPEILAFANAVGALATTKRGAIPGMPSREQVTGWLTNTDQSE